MKARHVVTLVVVLTLGAALTGIFLRIRAGDEEGTGSSGDAATDSVRASVQSTASAQAFATEVALPVEAAVVEHGTFVIWVSAEGRAAPFRTAPLHAEVEGSVVEVPVQEGGFVEAGALLARLDQTLYEIRVRRAQAAVDQAEADFLDRTLFDDQIEDAVQREERRRQARIRAGLDQAETNLEEARYELAKTEIRAPFSGRVANIGVAIGCRAGAGDSIATIVDLSQIEIDAEVLHSELPLVQVGREATATFPALPGETFTGRVVSINPLIDPETQMARVTVRLSNPEARIVPGMPGGVRIAGRLLADRKFVPKEAIVERNRRQVVFVFEPMEEGSDTGNAQWKYVTTGLENDRFIELIPAGEGSEETFVGAGGELVLIDGHATLTHDARVRIDNFERLVAGGSGGGP
jgi:membrane fusion protein (multidrug efflux system)